MNTITMHLNTHKKLLALFAFFLLLLPGCSVQEENAEDRFAEIISARAAEGGINRADPGYMQYIERQSMLHDAARMAQMVSGSNFIWRRPSAAPWPEALLELNNVWLTLNPQMVQTPGRSSVLAHLSSPALWSSLNESGITGLHIAPTGASGKLWDHDPKHYLGAHDNIIQYTFSKDIGTEQEYSRVIEQSKRHNILLGGDLIPAATGIGPDFLLAVRNLRNYPGIFCLIEVPKSLWSNLPTAKRDNSGDVQVMALNPVQIERLSREGLFPKSLRQDAIKDVIKTGWAATSEVRGNDGNLRRWVYRYAYDIKRPILNFGDPSSTAQQIAGGSTIFQSAILGNSLTAAQLSPLIGLEPDAKTPKSSTEHSDFALLSSVASRLASQSRAYGSNSWIKDELPMPIARELMQNGPDAVQGMFTPAAEHALLTGNASLLNFLQDEALNFGLDWSRLVHSSVGHEGLSYALPHLRYLASPPPSARIQSFRINRAKTLLREVPAQAMSVAAPKNRTDSARLFENNRLYTTPVGVSALALNIHNNSELTPENESAIRNGHMLLQFFKAMQPGIYMLAGQDLVGAMPVDQSYLTDERLRDKHLAAMGAFPLLSGAESGVYGSISLPKAKSIYGSVDMQLYHSASFLRELGELISLRQRLGIARGTVIGRLKSNNPGTSVLVTRLPRANQAASRPGARTYAISVVNFSQTESSEYLDLSTIPELEAILPNAQVGLATGNFLSMRRQENWLFMLEPGWSKGLVLIEEGPEPIIKEMAPEPLKTPEPPSEQPSDATDAKE